MAIEQGSMRQAINSIYQTLINDEQLLRLLWYKPKTNTGFDPLDESLPNIKSMNNYWDIINERIVLNEKINDLVEKPICRIHITSGRRRGMNGNYWLSNQEINIAILVHEEFENDMRSVWISDRINELIALESFQGMIGKLDYWGGNPRIAPLKYSRFDHVYEYVTSKK